MMKLIFFRKKVQISCIVEDSRRITLIIEKYFVDGGPDL